MEDLWFNSDALFTRYVTSCSLLHEPFVVIDVGVQGGVNQRWTLLEDYLLLHGFDAIAEVIADLKEGNSGRTNWHFHNYALGSEDGERSFYFNVANPTASSIYEQGAKDAQGQSVEQPRRVIVRRLDTLFANGTVPPADFLKVDVEGFEGDVFRGAQALIASGVLGIETESNFNVSPEYPKSHFSAISDILVDHGFTVFDIGFNRVPRPSFTRALRQKGVGELDAQHVGKLATVNFLFCRDLTTEQKPLPPSIDQIIKMMIIYELHGLNDIALDTADRFADQLATRLDMEMAMNLLANPRCRAAAMVSADDAATLAAEKQAAVARIRELEAELGTYKEAAVARIRELEAELGAYKEAAVARIRELEAELGPYKEAVARIRELEAELGSYKEAVARIRELEAELGAYKEAAVARIRELEAELGSYKEAAVARIRELEAELGSYKEAAVARIRKLEAELGSYKEAAVARIRELEAELGPDEEAAVARIRELEHALETQRRDYECSTSWRITSPLRAMKSLLVGRAV